MSGAVKGLSGLKTRELGRCHIHLETVDSTNDYLKRRAGELCHGASATASLQTAGKGRLGRQWLELPDKALALSVLLAGYTPAQLGQLPLLVGLAVSQGLEGLTGLQIGLKWSNDCILAEKKLCGILCESRILGNQVWTVVGIGVNTQQTAEQLCGLNLEYATSLFLATQKYWDIAQIGGEILNKLEEILDIYALSGFSALKTAYSERCVTLGKKVRIVDADRETLGEALGIAEDGGLICRVDGQEKIIRSGEASVRGLYGYT
ncbi:biotin--[acetyl-CoA-carboxylase] ligase [Oscillospiraceae bacterium MB08-C2-2]|nr:biotin--[acetyl-CoA-carboxylase] ligase [Oscillospiraceae bacterium MB08-C2-2]